MQKIKQLIFIIGISILTSNVFAQSIAPGSGNASAASRAEATSVNHYTGIPSISVPIYSYSHHNGLNFGISLDYFAGGVKLEEAPSTVGLGWNLSMGGVITRTVNGIPDDFYPAGFMFAAAIKTNAPLNGLHYYQNRVDAEPDVFQYNFNGRAGKFYIGKDSSILQVPSSKMSIRINKMELTDDPPIGGINCRFGHLHSMTTTSITSIELKAEDGVKYFFEDLEYSWTYYNSGIGYAGTMALGFPSAWYLTKILSASGRDSIKIKYELGGNVDYLQKPNQYASIVNGITIHPDTLGGADGPEHFLLPMPSSTRIPVEVTLPNSKKVEFNYGYGAQNINFKFLNTNDRVLRRIQIKDSILRYGYLLNWDTTEIGKDSRGFLTGVDYYNSTTIKKGYRFGYNGPFFKSRSYITSGFNSEALIYLNKQDHWGYYNGANNSQNYVPTVSGLYTGANREPNALAIASSLSYIKDPTGGTTFYDFENNDIYPFSSTLQEKIVDPLLNINNYIYIAKALGANTYFKVHFDASYVSTSGFPITGNANAVFQITDVGGGITYSIDTISLKDLYYTGITTFYTKVPASGNYVIKAYLAAGNTSTSNLPLKLSWYNQSTNMSTGNTIGGIRIKRMRHYNPFTNKMDTLSTYKYIREDGKSSGFIGKELIYDYWFCQWDGTWPNYENLHNISSNLGNNLDFSEGGAVGYSRVEVIKGTNERNLGKQVYEYTNINDEGYDNAPAKLPQTYVARKDWTWGLPKKISIFDNTGKLIQTTKNVFDYLYIQKANDTNYAALKTYRVCNNPTGWSAYSSQKYAPSSGRANLVATIDTFYHPNNSVTTSRKDLTYDNYFNVTKVVSPYDLNKNLNLEKRIYYPYNYTVGGAVGIMRDSGILVPVSNETWIMGDGNPRLLSAAVTDFISIGRRNVVNKGVRVKPSVSYALETNKPILQAAIGVFNPAVLVRDTNLIKPQQKITYNNYDMVLETQSPITNISNTSIYGYNNTEVIAQVSNAKNIDVAYTSFEPFSDGSWFYNNTAVDSTTAITGKYAYNLSGANNIFRNNLTQTITYLITYWTKGSVNIANATTAATLLDQRNGWNLYSQKISNLSEVYVYGSGLIDELRLHPIDANMTTTCYLPIGQVSCASDANNNIVYNEYDPIGALKIVRDKDKNIVKKYETSDSLFAVNLAPIWVNDSSPYGQFNCELDSTGQRTGNVLRRQVDTNPYSLTIGEYRYVFDRVDATYCPFLPPSCPYGPQWKLINNICQQGAKIVTASVYKLVVRPDGSQGYMWVCTYHYQWTDGSISVDFTEQSQSSCTIIAGEEP